jgi:COP9 signalosome complex subunit 4
LLLEEEEAGQAETYYTRAAVLIHSTTDKTVQLQYKLCQARLADFSRKFAEAATRYHELSWITDIDEEERLQALWVSISQDPEFYSNRGIFKIRSAAVTCAILAPAGPGRSRVLASLYRDERSASLAHFTILTKMFLEQIIRPEEIKDFEATLRPHQLARIAVSSNDKSVAALSSIYAADDDQDTEASGSGSRVGPSTVLDRAVMEHNVLSCSKIYSNITFRGLGALLDLMPAAAESMARKMIEQRRLRGATIDQVERLIWFEDVGEEEEGQGKAGGLGDVDQEEEDPGAPFTRKWDLQIRQIASNVS